VISALDRWQPMPLDEVRSMLSAASVSRVWLSGGVALDVWLGHATRSHGDIDVSVLRSDWDAFAGSIPSTLRMYAAEGGTLRPLGAHSDPPNNIWCTRDDMDAWVLQLNIEEGTDSEWRYRRFPAIRLEWERAVVEVAGIRVIAPEVQLLWKSKMPVEKDEADLTAVLPHLDASAREWLSRAIAIAHPTSPWAGDFGIQ
jgi:hypothetical protein